jgi:hypothetical protein
MTARDTSRFDWRLLAGPLVLLAGLALLKLSDILLTIGPLDRAAFGWSVPVPMLLLAPGLIGIAARWSGTTAGRLTAIATGVLLGVVVGVAWFASTTQVGCDPNPGLATRVLSSLPVPLVLGIGWSLAGWLAVAKAERPIRAVAVGAATGLATGAVMLLAWGLFFPGVTCTPGPVPLG